MTHFQLSDFDNLIAKEFCTFLVFLNYTSAGYFEIFLQIQKAQELSDDVSFVIFGHQTWNLGKGGEIDFLSWNLNKQLVALIAQSSF